MSVKNRRSKDPEERRAQRDARATRWLSGATGALGSYPVVFVAVGILAVWAISGPFFHFSDTWQLVINTFTSLVTFIMVFIIQNTQNRESRATQAKLDQLLKAVEGARTDLMGIEEAPEREIRLVQESERRGAGVER